MNSAIEILSPDKFSLFSVREIVESRERAFSETRMTAIDCVDDLVSDEYKPKIVSNVTFMFTLWLLRYLDESVLTSKFINGQRDILSSELEEFADEDIEDYCRRMGMHLDFDVEREIFSTVRNADLTKNSLAILITTSLFAYTMPLSTGWYESLYFSPLILVLFLMKVSKGTENISRSTSKSMFMPILRQ